MRRFFAKNILFVLFVNVLVKPIWIFVIDLTVQNRVGHQAYGTYQPLLNLAVIFQIILDFGINNYTSRRLAQFPGRAARLFPIVLSARLALAIVYLALVTTLGFVLRYSFAELWLLINLMFIQVLGSMTQLFRSTISGLHYFKWDGVLSVTDRMLMVLICGLLLFLPQTQGRFQLSWYVASLTASASVTVVIAWLLTSHLTGLRLRLSVNRRRILQIVRQSLPFAALILLMAVYTRADFVFLERIGGGEQGKEYAGIYASAYRLLDMGNMVGMMFATMLLPLFGRMLQQRQDVGAIARLSSNILIPFSLVAAIVSVFYGEDIMNLLYREPGEFGSTVFTLLMFCLPAISLSNVYSTLLTAGGWLRRMIVIAAIGVVVNVVLNLLLIPQLAVVGAAIAALVTQWVVGLLFLLSATRMGKLPIRPRWIASFVVYMVVVATTAWALRQWPVSWMVSCASLLAFSAFLTLPFGYIRLREISGLLHRN